MYGNFSHRIFHIPSQTYVTWPDGRNRKRGFLIRKLKDMVRVVNCDYGATDDAPAVELHSFNVGGRLIRRYVFAEVLLCTHKNDIIGPRAPALIPFIPDDQANQS